MEQVIQYAADLWDTVTQEGILALTLMDVIWIAGAITLIVWACKVVNKFFKVILILLAIAVVLYVLVSKGWLPL